MTDDDRYLQIVLQAVRACAKYKPNPGFGTRRFGRGLGRFQTQYRGDAFYRWFGLDAPTLYTHYRVTGEMNSIYRQIENGCENLIREIVRCSLGLSVTDVRWDNRDSTPSRAERALAITGRMPLDKISDRVKRERIHRWMRDAAKQLDIETKMFDMLNGIAISVIQGYRCNIPMEECASFSNSPVAYTRGYLPCVLILTTQFDADIAQIYRSEKWMIITGVRGVSDPNVSIYDFMDQIVGYDLEGFFDRNQQVIQMEVQRTLRTGLNETAG